MSAQVLNARSVRRIDHDHENVPDGWRMKPSGEIVRDQEATA